MKWVQKKETNADSLCAQSTLNSDTDRSSKRTCSKMDEVSNRWSGYRILVQTDVTHRSVAVLK